MEGWFLFLFLKISGHYVPQLAKLIFEKNNGTANPIINLKGFVVNIWNPCFACKSSNILPKTYYSTIWRRHACLIHQSTLPLNVSRTWTWLVPKKATSTLIACTQSPAIAQPLSNLAWGDAILGCPELMILAPKDIQIYTTICQKCRRRYTLTQLELNTLGKLAGLNRFSWKIHLKVLFLS